MKTKIFFTAFCLISFFLSGQTNEIIKQDYSPELSGECTITKSVISFNKGITDKTFYIEVTKPGKYYLSAWADGFITDKGMIGYNITINGATAIKDLVLEKTNWHSLNVKNAINLNTGTNTIAFSCEKEIPEIDFIRIAGTETNAKIPETDYQNMIDELKTHDLSKYPPITEETLKDSLKFLNKQVRTGGSPYPFPADYLYDLDQNFNYIYWKYENLQQGQNVSYQIVNYNCEPVMELFFDGNPSLGTWVKSGSGILNVTIPVSGTYILRVRPYWSGSSGTGNLYKNGSLYVSNIPLNWSYVKVINLSADDTVRNYFTTHLSNVSGGSGGDTRIWIEDRISCPGKIQAHNDDYEGDGDFSWGLASRIKKAFNVNIRTVWVSSYGSGSVGKCDVFVKAKHIGLPPPIFPNLKEDDQISAAPLWGIYYNCIAWSGGIYTDVDPEEDWQYFFVWPPDLSSPWYHNENLTDLQRFDTFYENQPYRYPCAWDYTRDGATSSNSRIDLWANDDGYQHASVRKGEDGYPRAISSNPDYFEKDCKNIKYYHPHGYDWESKNGSSTRIFHPRYALAGDDYGSVVEHYCLPYKKSKSPEITLKESIRGGLSMLDDVGFTTEQDSILNEMINAIPSDVKEKYKEKYNVWKATWKKPEIAIHSNPRKYAESEEYELFITYCKKQGEKILPLLFNNFKKGDYFAFNAIKDMTLQHRALFDTIRAENMRNQWTKDGKYIIRYDWHNAMKYIKRLLFSEDRVNFQKNAVDIDNTNEQALMIRINPNPITDESTIQFTLHEQANVSIDIYTLEGRLIKSLVNEISKTTGAHSVHFDASGINAGVYLCKIQINDKIINRRILIQ